MTGILLLDLAIGLVWVYSLGTTLYILRQQKRMWRAIDRMHQLHTERRQNPKAEHQQRRLQPVAPWYGNEATYAQEEDWEEEGEYEAEPEE